MKRPALGSLAPLILAILFSGCAHPAGPATPATAVRHTTPAAAPAPAVNTALVPLPRPDHIYNNLNGEGWMQRHEAAKARAAQGNIDLVFIGDSITHAWQFPGRGRRVWDEHYGAYRTLNLGFGGDRTEHVIWRLQQGEIDGLSPRLTVIMIGTNNTAANTAPEIAAGITTICDLVRQKMPQTQILLLAIFPRGTPDDPKRQKIQEINRLIEPLGQRPGVRYLDIGARFLTPEGTITREIMPDLLHPTEAGYRLWATAIAPVVTATMAPVRAQ